MKFAAITDLFRKPSADLLAAAELEDAKRELLLAQRQQAYAGKLAEFYQERIAALEARQ